MPGQGIEFRQASPQDVQWLLDLRLATMGAHFANAGEVLTVDDHRARVLQAFDAVRIVERHGAAIGMMKVVREADVWHLVQIQLLPEQQGRGIGGSLIQALLNEARAAAMAVSLHVLKVNPARRLYQRLGFTVVADLDHSYEMRAEPKS